MKRKLVASVLEFIYSKSPTESEIDDALLLLGVGTILSGFGAVLAVLLRDTAQDDKQNRT